MRVFRYKGFSLNTTIAFFVPTKGNLQVDEEILKHNLQPSSKLEVLVLTGQTVEQHREGSSNQAWIFHPRLRGLTDSYIHYD